MEFKTKITSAILAASFLALALPALAETGQATPPPPPPAPSMKSDAIDLACVASAVDKRDTAIIGAFDSFHDAIKSALQTRRDALKAAWALTDQKARRAAIKAAWSAYRASAQTARKALNQAQRVAWSKFNTERKSCGTGAAADDRTG